MLRLTKSACYMAYYGCVAYCCGEFIGDVTVCVGDSMVPTINSGNVVLTEHIGGTVRIHRGDIVTVRSPLKPKQFICKRVVGMPGDIMDDSCRCVPRGHFWLEGDNKESSYDSRSYGPIPQALVRGRVLCTVWPISTMRMLSDRWWP